MKKGAFILFFVFLFIRPLFCGENPADSIKELLTGKKNSDQILLLNKLGTYYLNDSPDVASSYYLKSYSYSKDLGVDSLIAISAYYLAVVKENDEEYKEAKKLYQEALRFYQNSDKNEKIAEITKNLGLIEYYLGHYQDAFSNYHASLKLYLKSKKEQEVADLYQNIGLLHHELENLHDALDYYKKSLKINEKLGTKSNIAALTQNLGLLYIREDKFSNALENIQKSLNIYEEINNSEGIAVSLSNIGLIYQNEGKYLQARDFYQKSLSVFDSIGYLLGKLWALHNVGTSYSDLKKYDRALDYYNKSLSLSQKMDHAQGIMANYEAMSNLYSDVSDYKQSLEYFKLFDGLKDSINSEETKKKISETEAYYKFELLNNELTGKSEELAQQKKQKHIFFAGLVILFGMLVSLVFAYVQKRKAELGLREHRNSLEKLVEEKTKELKTQISERKVAEESDRLKSAFLANMSHELRTPLNAIIAFTNFIRDPHLTDEKKAEYIDYVMAAGESLLHLIDDIIDIAKIEAKQISINPSSCNITQTCMELLKVFEELKKKKGKDHLSISISPDCTTKSIIITTDPQRLKQILTNLLENSLKYTNQGEIEFGFKKHERVIEFFVKDTGIGIPKEKYNYVFERFSQLDYSTSKEFGGTGLGLAITKNLVRLLGGEIWIDSQENKGSIFYFSIPYNDVEVLPYSPKESIKKSTASGLFDFYNWSGKTILIAEDEDLNYKVLESALARTNVKIIRARNGIEAIRKFDDHPIDLVLMDIQMPRMDGYEATKEIKKMNRNIPVIAQTSFAMEGEKEKCIMAGCDDYLSKPLNLSELFLTIENFIQHF